MRSERGSFLFVVSSIGIAACTAVLLAQSAKLSTTWTPPDSAPFDYAGKKVVALAFLDDMNLRMSAEEALAREITARGTQGIAAYRTIPREELKDREKARLWFEKTGVAGVVTVRIVDVDKYLKESNMLFVASYYQSFDAFYGTYWETVTPIGKPKETTDVVVETLLFDVAHGGKLLWGGVSETTNPKGVGPFITGLTKAVVDDLQKKGLVKKK